MKSRPVRAAAAPPMATKKFDQDSVITPWYEAVPSGSVDAVAVVSGTAQTRPTVATQRLWSVDGDVAEFEKEPHTPLGYAQCAWLKLRAVLDWFGALRGPDGWLDDDQPRDGLTPHPSVTVVLSGRTPTGQEVLAVMTRECPLNSVPCLGVLAWAAFDSRCTCWPTTELAAKLTTSTGSRLPPAGVCTSNSRPLRRVVRPLLDATNGLRYDATTQLL